MKLLKIAKHFLTGKRLAYGVIALVVVSGVGYIIFLKPAAAPETITVKSAEFVQQVSVSGKVVSAQNLDLSFEQAGITRGVYVKVGDRVKAGTLLAVQDTAQLSTQYAEMQAGIDFQKAKLNQLLAGSSAEDIKTEEDKVVSAKLDLQNSQQNALVVLDSTYNTIYNAAAVALTIQNTYFSNPDQEGLKVQDARLSLNATLADAKMYLDSAAAQDVNLITKANSNMVLALNKAYNQIKVIRDQCETGQYYLRVTAADKASLDSQKTTINTALANVVASQKSMASYQAAVVLAENNLNAEKAAARPTDIAVYAAQIKQAQAQAANVATQIRKRQIYSPMSGIVTTVDAKVGSILSGGQAAVSLISDGQFQVESYVPEIYISQVAPGNEATITFDAYGAGRVFAGKVISIDPAETVKDGVATYKVTLELQYAGDEIRNGMTSNVIITTGKKEAAISIPQGAVVLRDGKRFVKVQAGDQIVERQVETGSISLDGKIEITSGLAAGDIVVK